MMRRPFRTCLPALACAALWLSGCSDLAERVSSNADEADGKTSELVKDVGRNARGAVVPASARVVYEPGIWLGKNVVKLGQPPLPAIFYQPATFDRSIFSLSELAERLTLRSGIPSRVNADAAGIAANAFKRGRAVLPSPPAARQPAGGAALPLPPGMPGEPAPGAGDALQRSGAADASVSFQPDMQGGIRVSYANGSFKGLLDTVAARFGVSWKYADGVIQFYHTDARTFQISAVPGDASFAASVTSGAASSAAGGSGAGGPGGTGGAGAGSSVSANNSQNTGVVSKLSVYTGIENAVKVMLSPHGKVLAAPATGTITVVDTPDTLDRIGAYLESANQALSRQIVMNVTVLSVNLEQGDEYGINWNLMYNSLKNKYGLQNTFTGSPNAAALSAGIVGNSRFSGSTVIAKALAEQGKVRRQTTASVVTLNNQPVPVQVARQTSYLQSAQTSFVAQVGTTTTLTPGVVTAGFNMSILPHVLNNGAVMLQFSIDISTLRGIRVIESNNTRIESPEMDTRNFLQRVSMKSGETLVIGGFEQTDENVDRQGVGKPGNYLLGGGVKAKSNKEVIVVLITPMAMAGA